MDAKLRVVSGPFSGQSIDIPCGKLLIGRAADCDVRPDSEFVSNYHCVLLRDQFTLRIRDLDSRNGTYVNRRQISTHAIILLHDDTVSIGEMTFLVDLTPIKSESQPAESDAPSDGSPTALQGTGVFEGDTLKFEIPDGGPPQPAPPPVSAPAEPDVLPPCSDKHDPLPS